MTAADLTDPAKMADAAKDLSRADNSSHIAYRNEISDIAPRQAVAAD